jgi:hypothetical protein
MTGIIDQVRREFLAQAQVRTWAKVVAVVPTDEHLLIHPSGYSGNQTTRIARPDRLLLGTPLFVEYTE